MIKLDMTKFEEINNGVIRGLIKAGKLIPPMNQQEKLLLEKAQDMAAVEAVYADAEKYYQSNNPSILSAVQALHQEHVDTIQKRQSMNAQTVKITISVNDSMTPEKEEILKNKLRELQDQLDQGTLPKR